MFSVLGLPIEQAKKLLCEQNIEYRLVEYPARFKEPISLDSKRVVRQQWESETAVTLTVSEFKTSSQSR